MSVHAPNTLQVAPAATVTTMQAWREMGTSGYATSWSKALTNRASEKKVQLWQILCSVIRYFCAHKQQKHQICQT